MNYVIYRFTFPNNKTYIGRTSNYSSRLAEHKYGMTSGKELPLYKAFRKYGWDAVEKSILEEVETLQESIAKEYEYIVAYDAIRKGYNCTEDTTRGGNNWSGREYTEEFEQFRTRMQYLNKAENNGMFGKHHTDKSKDLQRIKAKGRFTLEWFKQKYGEEEGLLKYNQRSEALRSRNLARYGKLAP